VNGGQKWRKKTLDPFLERTAARSVRAAEPDGGFQARAHAVERARQLSDFVVGIEHQLRIEIAGANLAIG